MKHIGLVAGGIIVGIAISAVGVVVLLGTNPHLMNSIVAPIDPGTAVVHFSNLSFSVQRFYIDGRPVCQQECVVLIRLGRPRQLYAVEVNYRLSQSRWQPLPEPRGTNYTRTGPVSLIGRRGEEYRFLACGTSGVEGQNCGLFDDGPAHESSMELPMY